MQQARAKLTFNSGSGQDPGTLYYFRNLLTHRDVKGEVKNSYRPYKLLYYTVFDAICQLLLLHHFDMPDEHSNIPFPEKYKNLSHKEKVEWLNQVSNEILQTWFFENQDDICLEWSQHSENYWLSERLVWVLSNLMNTGNIMFKSLQKSQDPKWRTLIKSRITLTCHSSQELGHGCWYGGWRAFHKVSLIWTASIQQDKKSKIPNRFCSSYSLNFKYWYSLRGTETKTGCEQICKCSRWTNNNIALDEYLEMVNRDSKVVCTRNQMKERIILHSKVYPHLVNFVKHFDEIANIRQKKGFHHLPSYQSDVKKVLQDLMQNDILVYDPNRKRHCQKFVIDRNPFVNSFKKLPIMIHRYKPTLPFCRLRNMQY